MINSKEFKTIEEQLVGLEKRKLQFKNRKKAEQILRKYNYFDIINGFETILLKKSSVKEYENVYFEDFYDLYKFDMKLKITTLNLIFNIESRLRTAIAYHFSSVYCRSINDTMKYTDSKCYVCPQNANKSMQKKFIYFDLFKKTQYNPNGSIKKEDFVEGLKKTKSYIKQYEDPPFWVVIKALPLGSLYYTFVFLDDTVKELVLNEFGLELKDQDVFMQAIFILKEVRNECAHLELISRFRIRRNGDLNNYNDITTKINLSKMDLNYMDITKIFGLFGSNFKVKYQVVKFYIFMFLKGRKKIGDKALSKMGRKKLIEWIKI